MKRISSAAFLVLVCLAQIALAHHAANTKYDQTKKATLTGTVTKVEWLNPHIYFYIDVKDKDGKVTNWAIEGAPPNVLYRRGWGKDSLKVGETVTVEGYLPRQEGLHHLNGGNAVLPDGRKIFAGSANGLPGGTDF
jgi:hypothetical protein